MPRIDSEIKLDFKDVLFRPKRSTLKSRSEVRKNIVYIFCRGCFLGHLKKFFLDKDIQKKFFACDIVGNLDLLL